MKKEKQTNELKELKNDFTFFMFNVNQMINYHKIFIETNNLTYGNLFVYHSKVVTTLVHRYFKKYPDKFLPFSPFEEQK